MKNRETGWLNKKRANNILDIIESNGFHVTSKKFGSGYFIYSLGSNAVCHFKLKELPDFLFGIWLYDNNKFEIFGQFELYLDKFKPSRNEVSKKTTLESFLEGIKFIQENHDRYITDSYWWWEDYETIENGWQNKNWTPEYGKQEIERMYSKKENSKKKDMEEYHRTYNILSKELFDKFPCIWAVGVRDRSSFVWPKYSVVVLANNSTDETWNEINNYLFAISRKLKCTNYINGLDVLFDTQNCPFKKELKSLKKKMQIDYLFVKED